MERIPVVSSTVAEVGYSEDLKTLEVLFRSGAIYLYYFVPPRVHEALMRSEDHGTYFHRFIKGVYEYHRIAEPETQAERRRKPQRKTSR